MTQAPMTQRYFFHWRSINWHLKFTWAYESILNRILTYLALAMQGLYLYRATQVIDATSQTPPKKRYLCHRSLLHTQIKLIGCCNSWPITLFGHYRVQMQIYRPPMKKQLCHRSLWHTQIKLFGCCKLGSITLQAHIGYRCQFLSLQ